MNALGSILKLCFCKRNYHEKGLRVVLAWLYTTFIKKDRSRRQLFFGIGISQKKSNGKVGYLNSILA